MSISTHSVFYYGLEIDETNNKLNFDEGAGELTATLNNGFYTHEDLALEIKQKMTTASTLPQVYAVLFDRVNRTFQISSDNNFSLLVATGSQSAVSCFPTIGFSLTDRSGDDTYSGNLATGKVYYPQFFLQDYLDDRFMVEKIDATVSESADGQVQTVFFGTRKFVKMNIKLITDKPQDGLVIRNNPNGVNDFLDFMNALIDKRPVEFMPNINDRNTFKTLIIEDIPGGKDGTGFEIVEMIGQNLPEYYETGLLKFRVR